MSSCTACPTWSSTRWLKGRPRPGAATFAVLWCGLSVPELGFDRAARVPLERAAETDSVVQRRLVALLADAVVDASGGDEEAAWLSQFESDDQVECPAGRNREPRQLGAAGRVVVFAKADARLGSGEGVHAEDAHAGRQLEELDPLDRHGFVTLVDQPRPAPRVGEVELDGCAGGAAVRLVGERPPSRTSPSSSPKARAITAALPAATSTAASTRARSGDGGTASCAAKAFHDPDSEVCTGVCERLRCATRSED